MKKIRFCVFFLCSFIGSMIMNQSDLSAQDTLKIYPANFYIDQELGLVVCNSPLNGVTNLTAEVEFVELDQVYELSNATPIFEVGRGSELIANNGNKLTIYFSELPLISIRTTEIIMDEPRVFAEFSLKSAQEALHALPIGIEYKGGWTQTLEKKSYRIEFWADSTGVETENISLLAMRSDDDWNLEAMFNEPLRVRNVTNAKLWEAIHTPYYLDREPEARGAIDLKYVELFINDRYQGIYALSERIDRKLLKLKKYDSERRGELYKAYSWGASTFGTLPDYNNASDIWGGYEYRYPSEIIDWEDLHGFTDFVINESNDAFYDEWDNRFERSNAIDYFIFLNVIGAKDNTGKNIYTAKYDEGEPYFYLPFDLDGTYGLVWNGEIDDVSEGILSNGFYDRLLMDCSSSGFSTELKERWEALRIAYINRFVLSGELELNHDYLSWNHAYAREEMVWSDFKFKEENIDQLHSWIDRRLTYLDSYFDNLCKDVGTQEIETKKFTLNGNLSGGNFFLSNSQIESDYSCKVFNSLGQLCFSSYNNPNVDLSHCAVGSYHLVLEYEGGVDFQRIVLMR